MKYNAIYLVLPLLLIPALSACAAFIPAYSAEAIEGRVVDADTKEPVEGVVVTADWELRRSGYYPGGSPYGGELMVMESVTDKNGRFSFVAWGPIRQFKGELHEHDPRLILFKSGYRYQSLSNETESALESVHRSQWNGKTIELKQFKGTLDEWAKNLGLLTTSLRFIEEDCNWKKTPRMILSLDSEKERLRQNGIIRTFYSVSYLPTDEKKCGSPRDFFRDYTT